MSVTFRATLAALAVLAAPELARATTLTFEDLDRGYPETVSVPAGYGGFTWEWLDATVRPADARGTIGDVSVVNRLGTKIPWGYGPRIRRDVPFTFQGVCMFAMSQFGDTSVMVEGWRGGVLAHAQTVDAREPSCHAFDFAEVDEVRFYPGSMAVVVLDELEFRAQDSVPPYLELREPAPLPWPAPPIVDSAELRLAGRAYDAGGFPPVAAGSVWNGDVSVPLVVDELGLFDVRVPLAEGLNDLLLQVSDEAGNTSALRLNVIRDSAPPVVEIVTPAGGAALTFNRFDLLARVTDSTVVRAFVDIAPPGGSAWWSFEVPVAGAVVAAPGLMLPQADGTYEVRLRAVDFFGRWSSASAFVTLDLTGPVVTVVDAPTGSWFGPFPGDLLPLHVTVSDPLSTTLTTSFSAPIELPAGGLTVALDVPLVEGPQVVELDVVAVDWRATHVSIPVVYDTTPPAAAFLSPAADAALRGAVEVSIAATDDTTGVAAVSLAVDGGPAATADGSGTWTTTLQLAELADGPHLLRATVVDGVGNTAIPELRVVVDRTRPSVALDGPAAGAFVRGPISFAARAADATSGVREVELRANGTLIASCAGAAPCSASLDTTRLPDGPFEVTAVAFDRAGNESELARLGLVADNSAPARFVLRPAPGAVVSGAVDVAVHVSDAAFAWVECAAGGVSLGRSTEPGAAWRFDSTALLDGALAIACTAADVAGNLGSETVTVTVRNWDLALAPATLHLSSGVGAAVTLSVEGTNVALLAAAPPDGLALLVPGGAPVPLDAHAEFAVGDADHDKVPDLDLKFSRAALVASIEGAIAAGALPAPGQVAVALVAADGRRLGMTRIEVR